MKKTLGSLFGKLFATKGGIAVTALAGTVALTGVVGGTYHITTKTNTTTETIEKPQGQVTIVYNNEDTVEPTAVSDDVEVKDNVVTVKKVKTVEEEVAEIAEDIAPVTKRDYTKDIINQAVTFLRRVQNDDTYIPSDYEIDDVIAMVRCYTGLEDTGSDAKSFYKAIKAIANTDSPLIFDFFEDDHKDEMADDSEDLCDERYDLIQSIVAKELKTNSRLYNSNDIYDAMYDALYDGDCTHSHLSNKYAHGYYNYGASTRDDYDRAISFAEQKEFLEDLLADEDKLADFLEGLEYDDVDYQTYMKKQLKRGKKNFSTQDLFTSVGIDCVEDAKLTYTISAKSNYREALEFLFANVKGFELTDTNIYAMMEMADRYAVEDFSVEVWNQTLINTLNERVNYAANKAENAAYVAECAINQMMNYDDGRVDYYREEGHYTNYWEYEDTEGPWDLETYTKHNADVAIEDMTDTNVKDNNEFALSRLENIANTRYYGAPHEDVPETTYRTEIASILDYSIAAKEAAQDAMTETNIALGMLMDLQGGSEYYYNSESFNMDNFIYGMDDLYEDIITARTLAYDSLIKVQAINEVVEEEYEAIVKANTPAVEETETEDIITDEVKVNMPDEVVTMEYTYQYADMYAFFRKLFAEGGDQIIKVSAIENLGAPQLLAKFGADNEPELFLEEIDPELIEKAYELYIAEANLDTGLTNVAVYDKVLAAYETFIEEIGYEELKAAYEAQKDEAKVDEVNLDEAKVEDDAVTDVYLDAKKEEDLSKEVSIEDAVYYVQTVQYLEEENYIAAEYLYEATVVEACIKMNEVNEEIDYIKPDTLTTESTEEEIAETVEALETIETDELYNEELAETIMGDDLECKVIAKNEPNINAGADIVAANFSEAK